MTYEPRLRGRTAGPLAPGYDVGDVVMLDGTIPAVVTRVGVYVHASHEDRETGVSVRPLIGGRARPVSLYRLRLVKGSDA